MRRSFVFSYRTRQFLCVRVYVCVCVCACVQVCVTVCSQVDTILKENHLHEMEHARVSKTERASEECSIMSFIEV